MRRIRVVVLIIVALAGAAILFAVSVLWTPAAPVPERQAAAATRLESVLPVLDELGVAFWSDSSGCRYVGLTPDGRFQDPAGTCGDAAPFDARAQVAWDRVAAAVAGTVDGARIETVLVMDGTVTFIAIPRTMLGRDALVMRWVWRWNEALVADPGLPDHWEFQAANEAIV